MPWPKGRKKAKTGGRVKGSKNILPGAKSVPLREMVENALEARGGQKYLERLDDKSFVQLVSKLLPTQVKAEVEIPSTIIVQTGFEEGPPE